MALTKHGHQIPGTLLSDPEDMTIVRCGGVGICPSCNEDAAHAHRPLCTDHRTVQHRDGKPPWCPKCGLTAGFKKPETVFPKDFEDLPEIVLGPSHDTWESEVNKLIKDLDEARVHAKGRLSYSEIQERLRSILRRHESQEK